MPSYEYRIRADLPHGFPQLDTTYATWKEADAARTVYKETANAMEPSPQTYRDAMHALGDGWIESRVISDWTVVEEK